MRSRVMKLVLTALSALVIVGGLTACGTNDAAFAENASVCRHITARSTSVTMHRVTTMPTSNLPSAFALPKNVKTTKPETARHIATLVCDSPAYPDNDHHAIVPGYHYTLTFSGHQGKIAQLSVGLRSRHIGRVTGLVPDQAALFATHSPVWSALGSLAASPHATEETFVGTPTNR